MNEYAQAVMGLPAPLREVLQKVPREIGDRVQEICLRLEAPVMLSTPQGEWFVTREGRVTPRATEDTLFCTRTQLSDAFQILCDFSVHTHQQELRQGYLAVRGGCRAGVAGTAVVENDRIQSVRSITSLCLRVARRHDGCARELARSLVHSAAGGKASMLYSTLICGEPASGKTSLLRDLARGLSSGDYGEIRRVAVVDERGELSGAGELPLCDVLRGCPKAEGIQQAVRCLSPEVVLFDELGSREETQAVLAGLNAGAAAIATAHCRDIGSLLRRPQIRMALEEGAFEKVVLLQGRRHPGETARILSADDVLRWKDTDSVSDGGLGRRFSVPAGWGNRP